jgi:hypothetical protein
MYMNLVLSAGLKLSVRLKSDYVPRTCLAKSFSNYDFTYFDPSSSKIGNLLCRPLELVVDWFLTAIGRHYLLVFSRIDHAFSKKVVIETAHIFMLSV